MQESTVTIEEVEDEVVDLIGVFNNFARSSNVRMVKEVRKRPCPPSQFRLNERTSEEDSEEGMPKKHSPKREHSVLCGKVCKSAATIISRI